MEPSCQQLQFGVRPIRTSSQETRPCLTSLTSSLEIPVRKQEINMASSTKDLDLSLMNLVDGILRSSELSTPDIELDKFDFCLKEDTSYTSCTDSGSPMLATPVRSQSFQDMISLPPNSPGEVLNDFSAMCEITQEVVDSPVARYGTVRDSNKLNDATFLDLLNETHGISGCIEPCYTNVSEDLSDISGLDLLNNTSGIPGCIESSNTADFGTCSTMSCTEVRTACDDYLKCTEYSSTCDDFIPLQVKETMSDVLSDATDNDYRIDSMDDTLFPSFFVHLDYVNKTENILGASIENNSSFDAVMHDEDNEQHTVADVQQGEISAGQEVKLMVSNLEEIPITSLPELIHPGTKKKEDTFQFSGFSCNTLITSESNLGGPFSDSKAQSMRHVHEPEHSIDTTILKKYKTPVEVNACSSLAPKTNERLCHAVNSAKKNKSHDHLTESQKYLRIREQNNIASKKSREKKKEKYLIMSLEVEELEVEHKDLIKKQEKLKNLRDRAKIALKKII